jgi:hypothetical protein
MNERFIANARSQLPPYKFQHSTVWTLSIERVLHNEAEYPGEAHGDKDSGKYRRFKFYFFDSKGSFIDRKRHFINCYLILTTVELACCKGVTFATI